MKSIQWWQWEQTTKDLGQHSSITMIKNAWIICDSKSSPQNNDIASRSSSSPTPRDFIIRSGGRCNWKVLWQFRDGAAAHQWRRHRRSIPSLSSEFEIAISFASGKGKFRWNAIFFDNWGFHNLALHRSEESANREELRESALAIAELQLTCRASLFSSSDVDEQTHTYMSPFIHVWLNRTATRIHVSRVCRFYPGIS
jgi:hypothetical protein